MPWDVQSGLQAFFCLKSVESFVDGLKMRSHHIEQPSIKQVIKFIKKNQRSYVIILFLHCQIVYVGRAESILSWGDYLLIRKPDGTLLIHGSTKREPINWQPAGSTLSMDIINNKLVLKSKRVPPEETIIVESDRVYLALAVRCKEGEFKLVGSESDMVENVIQNSSMVGEEFTFLHREYQTPYGNIDLLGRDTMGVLTVFEFKRATAQLSAVSQLKRYVDYLKSSHTKVRGILVAPDITASALQLLEKNGLEFKRYKKSEGNSPSKNL